MTDDPVLSDWSIAENKKKLSGFLEMLSKEKDQEIHRFWNKYIRRGFLHPPDDFDEMASNLIKEIHIFPDEFKKAFLTAPKDLLLDMNNNINNRNPFVKLFYNQRFIDNV
ncbi:MAG: hypothetical protein PHC61_01285 [Chitinivibrionales bacterium]|nr:hypothetical protein [Chitinivibrionales bacterium]